MLEFESMEKNVQGLKINAGIAHFMVDDPSDGLITVEAGEIAVSTRHAVLNEYSEDLALTGIRRTHVAESGLELGVDMESSIPFGAEPEISRKYRIQEDTLEVVSDLILRNSFEMKNIIAGGLEFSGAMESLEYVPYDGECCEIACAEKIQLDQIPDGTVIWDSAYVPLRLGVRDARGNTLMFLPGEDYWRWIHAARIQGKSRYTVKKEEGKIVFEWHLYGFTPAGPEALPPNGRNWRLSWLLQWQSGNTGETVLPAACKAVIDLTEQNWRKDALIQTADGKTGDLPCAASAAVLNHLKKWLRTHLVHAEAGDVYGVIADSHICYAAAHLNRAKQKTLPHRDDIALLKFKRWANRQLAASGARLVIMNKITE